MAKKTQDLEKLAEETLLYIQIQGSTFSTDIASALKIEDKKLAETLNYLHRKGYTEDNEGFTHLTYEGLKAANIIKEHREVTKIN
jgi:Mn-dependent DtxR family transcriptional regulator